MKEVGDRTRESVQQAGGLMWLPVGPVSIPNTAWYTEHCQEQPLSARPRITLEYYWVETQNQSLKLKMKRVIEEVIDSLVPA